MDDLNSVTWSRTAPPPRMRTRTRVYLSLLAGVLVGAVVLFSKSPQRAPRVSPNAPATATEQSSLLSHSTLRRACDGGDAIACNDLGVVYERGSDLGYDGDRASHYFDRACAAGNADGCSNLGAYLERSSESASDVTSARRLYEHACDAGVALACSNLGALYAAGRGVARDVERARDLFAAACAAGSDVGCRNGERLHDHGGEKRVRAAAGSGDEVR